MSYDVSSFLDKSGISDSFDLFALYVKSELVNYCIFLLAVSNKSMVFIFFLSAVSSVLITYLSVFSIVDTS